VDSKNSLQAYNTFGLDISCKSLLSFKSENELTDLYKNTETLNKNFLVLGGGSNVLFTQNFEGTVLKNEILGINILEDEKAHVVVEIGGGEVWHEFVLWSIENNLGGIENMSLIPGSVGAAPMQNIGAYGTEIKDVFHSLDAFEISTGKIKTFNGLDCNFGYRESVFKRELKGQFIITKVRFRLTKAEFHVLNTSYGMINSELEKRSIKEPTIKDISDAVIAIRQSKLPDPKEIGNSGSFFKNPILPNEQLNSLKKLHQDIPIYPVDENHSKTAAGWLIDQAGWKGYRKGDYGVHKNQALVLVNYGNAKGSEIFELSKMIIKSIKDKFGIELEREVNIY
jgi:UDP-N-acetylmuramate dehydrogenase